MPEIPRTPPPDKNADDEQSTMPTPKPARLFDGAIDFSKESSSETAAKKKATTKVYKCGKCRQKWDERLVLKWLKCDWCDEYSCFTCFDTESDFELLSAGSAAVKMKCEKCRFKKNRSFGVQCCFQATNKPIQETSSQTDSSTGVNSTQDAALVNKSGDACIVSNDVVAVVSFDAGTQTGGTINAGVAKVPPKAFETVHSIVVAGLGFFPVFYSGGFFPVFFRKKPVFFQFFSAD